MKPETQQLVDDLVDGRPSRRTWIAPVVGVPLLVSAMFLWEPLREFLVAPEVIHNTDGVPFYRLRGEDAEQQAIETCYELGNRQIRYGGLGSDPVIFCCAPRGSDECDRP